jgi:hypothetical protein
VARALIPAADSPLRRPLGVALLIVVTLAHLWLSDELLEDRLGFGAQREVMRRIEVSYVRELAVAAPPVPAAAPPKPKPRPRRAAVAKAPAASAPASSVLDGAIIVKVEPLPAPVVATPSPLAEQPAPPLAAASQPAIVPPETAASAPLAVAVASATPAPAAASAPAFDWPPSTRLTYVMNGNYRGEVQGSATVEWIRVGLRYQVHMEAIVGASFAPLLVRRASSEGELGDNGLTPRRFEGEQRVAFKSRRWAMSFDPERVHLPEGREVPAPPGVQDEASLFVQLTWLFTTQPQALRAGRRIEVPLALPRRVDTWTYDVIGEETLRMPFGEVSTVHVKPRRPARSTDLSAQMWFAPGLQYLPVRILVHQDTDTFIDLQLQRAPQQSAER